MVISLTPELVLRLMFPHVLLNNRFSNVYRFHSVSVMFITRWASATILFCRTRIMRAVVNFTVMPALASAYFTNRSATGNFPEASRNNCPLKIDRHCRKWTVCQAIVVPTVVLEVWQPNTAIVLSNIGKILRKVYVSNHGCIWSQNYQSIILKALCVFTETLTPTENNMGTKRSQQIRTRLQTHPSVCR